MLKVNLKMGGHKPKKHKLNSSIFSMKSEVDNLPMLAGQREAEGQGRRRILLADNWRAILLLCATFSLICEVKNVSLYLS